MVFGFGKKAAPPAAKAANATKKNQPTSNKRMVTYKVFKGYTPKAKRSTFSRRNLRNTVWDLASEDPKPSDATFTAALARYQELDKKAKKTPLEEDEYNTLKLLLHHYKKTKPLTPNSFKSILPLVYTEEGLASRNAASIAAKAASPIVTVNDPTPRGPNAAASRSNANTGDPTINGTIQRMKCTVCESQSIIDKALNPGEAPRKCDICGAKAVVAASAAAPAQAAAAAAKAAAAPGLKPGWVEHNNNNNVSGNKARAAAAAEAEAATRAYNPFNNKASYDVRGITGVSNITINLNNPKLKNWDLRRQRDNVIKAIIILKHLKEIKTATNQDKFKLDQLEELKTKLNERLGPNGSPNGSSTRKNRKDRKNRRNTRTQRK